MNSTKLLTYQPHPSILFCGMKHKLSLKQPGLQGLYAFEGNFWWQLFAISSNCQRDCEASLLCTAGFHGNCVAATEFQNMVRWHLKLHCCLTHIENSGQRVSIVLRSYHYKSVEFYCLPFEIVRQMLVKGGLCLESDGTALLLIFVPAYSCFECGIIAEFFCLLMQHQSTDSNS